MWMFAAILICGLVMVSHGDRHLGMMNVPQR